jgi:hypothetical protein
MGLIEDYIAYGWKVVPVPPGTKGPRSPGWNTPTGAIASASVLPEGFGVGLMHAFSGTMALDIDDWELTRTRIDINTLYAAPDAVTIQSGKPGRGKLLYAMPFGLTLPSKQFRIEDESGEDRLAFELRCGTTEGKTVQDILPPSIHPDTGMPYTWGGSGHWTRLPMVPQEIIDIWFDAIKDVRPVTVDGVDSSWDEIQQALAHIPPDCSRDEWISVGMALHWAGEQTFNSDQAISIWNDWSAKGAKYPGENEIWGQWGSFRTTKGQVVTLGTLFHLARKHGWVRPLPDASVLFADVSKMAKPEDILEMMRPKPPDLDLSLWPKVLATRAQEVSHSVGCDPLVPLWAGMAAVCGVIDAQTRLELMPGFKVPPVLWMMTLGDPGDRKSPGSRPMLSPLKDIEASDRSRYAQAVQAWEVQEAAWSVQKKALLDYAGSDKGMLAPEDAPIVPPLPQKPVPLKITVSDITSQKLVRQAADRPRGLLCYLDEMNAWVGKLTNGSSGEDRSAWVVGYEAEAYEMDRVGAGAVHCENFAVSIYGNMQPQVLTENFDKLASDGLLQRFLPAVLRHDQTRIGNPLPEFMTTAETWENLLRLTFALPATVYKLSPEAFAVFRRFQEWYEDRMQSERLIKSSPEFITAFGKITGLAGRLILIFHAIESPFNPVVGSDTVERVVRIVREYVVPTYRYVFDAEGSMSAFDAWIVEHIIQHADKPSVTMGDIKRSARRQFEKAKVMQNWHQNEWTICAMYILAEMNWVRRIDDGSKESQGHAEWLINPHLATTFQDYRAAVVKAKLQRDRERLDKAGITYTNPYQHGAEVLEYVQL